MTVHTITVAYLPADAAGPNRWRASIAGTPWEAHSLLDPATAARRLFARYTAARNPNECQFKQIGDMSWSLTDTRTPQPA